MISKYPTLIELFNRLYVVDNSKDQAKLVAIIKEGQIARKRKVVSEWVEHFLKIVQQASHSEK